MKFGFFQPKCYALILFILVPICARADEEAWALHGQATVIEQYHPAFRSLYKGQNSLDSGSRGDETVNVSAYAGARLWKGAEAWANLDLDQGFGLSNTLGIAAFPNGQGSKVGKTNPYFRLQRLFIRQSYSLGGEEKEVSGQANQLQATRQEENIIITVGKFAATDIFDTNDYAHDPMKDFLNWAVMDAGPYDFAADAWGYTYGGSIEWNLRDWSFRTALFDLSRIPNGTALTRGFGQYQINGEIEYRTDFLGREGKFKLLGFASRGRIGDYNDAVAQGLINHAVPSIASVRKASWKTGGSLNLQQSVTDDLGAFLRVTVNDGSKEGEEFTDMANSLQVGVSLKGASWDRKDDTIGLVLETGGITDAAKKFFAAGGLGILIGDGRLNNYGRETVVEAYYSVNVCDGILGTFDYQFVANPAYNADRGPVSVLGARIHGEF